MPRLDIMKVTAFGSWILPSCWNEIGLQVKKSQSHSAVDCGSSANGCLIIPISRALQKLMKTSTIDLIGSRLWTQQEVVLAQHIDLWCSKTIPNLDSFLELSSDNTIPLQAPALNYDP